MPRLKFNLEQLIEKDDTRNILTVYYIKGLDKGISFSEFEHILGSEENFPINLFKDRETIQRWTIKNRLKQMVRAGLLVQKEPGSPYFLKEKWYNLPIKIITKRIIEKFNIDNLISSYDIYKNITIPSYNEIDVLFGLNFENISNDNKILISEKISKIMQSTLDLFQLKHDMINQEGSLCLNALYSSLDDSEKNIWDEIKIKNSNFFKDMINLSLEQIIVNNGELPNDLIVEVFFKKDDEKIRLLKIKAIKALNNKLINCYPFGVGIFSYYNMNEYDDIIPIKKNKRILSKARIIADEIAQK